MNRIYFTKIRTVRNPERAYGTAAGIDFFIPTIDDKFIQDFIEKNPTLDPKSKAAIQNVKEIWVFPGERVLIPSGIRVDMIPKESMLMAANKSGVSTKLGLLYTAEIVDSDYTGEVHIGLYNSSNKKVILTSGQKIIQFIHTPIIPSVLQELNSKEYEILTSQSARGEGGFGSSDNITEIKA